MGKKSISQKGKELEQEWTPMGDGAPAPAAGLAPGGYPACRGRNSLADAVSSASRAMFDAIDEAHAALAGFQDLSASVPSFVVVGMQSVGKSAVLRRISGFPFPQDSEVCTRLAIELRMRRCRGVEEQPCTEVFAKDEVMPLVNRMEDTLKQAQAAVLGDKQFESRDFVRITTRGPNMPEVTLIDLPGIFFAKTDGDKALEELVYGMVRDRIAEEMALICHVVPLNQDSDTLSTWKMVNDADPDHRRTVYIFTKADLVGSKEEFAKRIQKVAGASPHVQGFIVHGKAEDGPAELGFLQNVQGWVDDLSLSNVLVGTEALSAHLEQRMIAHVTEKIPQMRRALEKELAACVETLEAVGRAPMSAFTIAAGNTSRIGRVIQQQFEELLPEARATIEAMAGEVSTKCGMVPLGLVDEKSVAKYVAEPPFNQIAWSAPQKEALKHWIALALEVRHIVEKSRKTNNVPFEGTTAALRAWMPKFAEASSHIMESFVDEVFAKVKATVAKAQEEACSEPFRTALRLVVMPAIRDVLTGAQSEAMATVSNMKQWNCGPDLLTTCTRELDSYAGFGPADENVSKVMDESDIAVYLKTAYIVNGFMHVQQILVADCLQRETMRILRASFQQIDAVLSKCVTHDIAQLITEPQSTVLQRVRCLAREDCLQKALQAVRSCYAARRPACEETRARHRYLSR